MRKIERHCRNSMAIKLISHNCQDLLRIFYWLCKLCHPVDNGICFCCLMRVSFYASILIVVTSIAKYYSNNSLKQKKKKEKIPWKVDFWNNIHLDNGHCFWTRLALIRVVVWFSHKANVEMVPAFWSTDKVYMENLVLCSLYNPLRVIVFVSARSRDNFEQGHAWLNNKGFFFFPTAANWNCAFQI